MKRKQFLTQLLFIFLVSTSLVFIPSKSHSPASFLQQIFVPRNGQIVRALFTPQDDITKTLTALINNEQESIYVAIYYLTCSHIASALKKAHRRGVKIRIITDAKHVEKCSHTRIFDLHDSNLDIHVYKSGKNGLMHNKFLIFGNNIENQPLLSTGSFNLTLGAQRYNRENVLVTNHRDTIREYTKQFEDLQRNSEPLQSFIKRINLN